MDPNEGRVSLRRTMILWPIAMVSVRDLISLRFDTSTQRMKHDLLSGFVRADDQITCGRESLHPLEILALEDPAMSLAKIVLLGLASVPSALLSTCRPTNYLTLVHRISTNRFITISRTAKQTKGDASACSFAMVV
jgi:hypothetical protein